MKGILPQSPNLQNGTVNLKCQCKVSMKKEKQDVSVSLSRAKNGQVALAGLSGYCNHVMALLLEIANYSLNQLKNVPEEISCTIHLRQWVVPGDAYNKAPVTHLIKNIQEAIDQDNYACGVFIDLQKAFDTVNHKILVKKLEYYGV